MNRAQTKRQKVWREQRGKGEEGRGEEKKNKREDRGRKKECKSWGGEKAVTTGLLRDDSYKLVHFVCVCVCESACVCVCVCVCVCACVLEHSCLKVSMRRWTFMVVPVIMIRDRWLVHLASGGVCV